MLFEPRHSWAKEHDGRVLFIMHFPSDWWHVVLWEQWVSECVFSVWLLYNCSIFYLLLDGTSHKYQQARQSHTSQGISIYTRGWKSEHIMYMYCQVHRFLRQQAKLSTAVDAAYAEPNKDPPRAEQRDDTVEEMVGRISLHVCLNNLIGTKQLSHAFSWRIYTQRGKRTWGAAGWDATTTTLLEWWDWAGGG